MATRSNSFVERREGEFWVNALIGAVVMVVLSWIPFATVLGGGVAGYLQRGTRMEGARTGAVSGLVAAVPVFAVLGVFSFGAVAGGEALGAAVFVAIALFALAVTAAVVAGTGAVGGYLGVYLRERTDDDDHGPAAADPAVEVDPETAP
jgi:hypothetical protein